jgi:hypothetical protein
MRRLPLLVLPLAVAIPAPATATPACAGAYTSGTGIADRAVSRCVPNSGKVTCFDIWVNVPTGGVAVVWACYPLPDPA